MNADGFTPGTRFKSGKLYFFSDRGDVTVIKTWPDLTAVAKSGASARWQDYWPTFRVILPYRRAAREPSIKKQVQGELPLDIEFSVRLHRATERKRAFDSFRFSFPKTIANIVERFRSEQWSVLHLLKGDPQAMDLVSTHPAIVFLTAHYYIGRFQKANGCPRVSHLKQKALVHQFGFPALDAVVNILRKVPAESVSTPRLVRLRAALGNPEIQKTLSHLAVVNAGVIELAGDEELWRQTSPRLLREVSEFRVEKYRAETAEALHQICAMQQTLLPGRRFVFQSRDQVLRVQDELALEYCQKAPKAIQACVFPRPPLPGITNCIIPLRTPAELVEEGNLQRNCVATYAKKVEAGDVFIYRVLFPERATLSVVREENGIWERDELKAAWNAPVSATTERTVEE